MKLNINVQQAKVFISWNRVEADYFRVFCKFNGNFTEYAKVRDTDFMKMSLLPYGENSCYVEAIKNGLVVDKTPVKTFNIETIDSAAFTDGGGCLNIRCSEFKGAKGYRLYADKGDYNFNGRQNSESPSMTILYEKGISYKIKPYASDEKGSRLILQSSGIFENTGNPFKALSVHKSYGNSLFLSWLYEDEADGFEVYQKDSDYPVFETADGLRHYVNLKNYNPDTKFYVKAYINSPNGRITVSKSDYVICSQTGYKEPKISLIIPAYNAENYIARSIDTALASTFPDVEIVIVNDGSTDKTQNIIDWYTKDYDNIVSLQKRNGGVADTRNTGIKAAKGDYIAFLDNDDMIRPDMLEKLYNTITKNGCDVAVAPLYRVLDGGYTTHCNLPFAVDTRHDINKYLEILYTPNYYNCAVWNKLYKAEIVKAHPFGLLKYEDVSWTPCILSWAETFCFLDTPFYEWDRKLRPQTFGDVLARMPEEELFEHRRQAMLFFVTKGNPAKLHYLKEIAKRRLLRYNGNSHHPGYKELIKRIETDEYQD